MGAGGDTGSGAHPGLVAAPANGQPPPGPTRGSSRQGVDQQAAKAVTDGPAPLRLPGSFDAFYQEHYSGLVQLAFVLSGSRYGAEDIAQDALVAAWKKWGALEQPLAWTRRVVANLAVSAIRRRMAEGRAMLRLAVRRASRSPSSQSPTPSSGWRSGHCRPANAKWSPSTTSATAR
jgi:Sigma-70 region 2